jgi:dihydrofolate reductase
MQANGGRNENLDPGMERGGWARPLFDDEAMTFVHQVYQRADAFLFGRRTYELFAGYWGVREDLEDPIVGALDTKPKYVASNTLTDPQWAAQSSPATSRRPSVSSRPGREASCRCTAAAP